MSKELSELSRAEWLIMNICWNKGELTARNVYEEALMKKKWEYQTVKTMLDRLANKGYLRRRKFGPICLYRPAVSRSKVVKRAIEAFSNTVLGDTFVPLFAHLAKGRALSDEEIAALEKLIEEHGEDEDDERP